ncbi:ubiquitin carboxyl-terminal hydrolase 15 [Frankliniella occidentalis]|uniref:Ubiquitin carboxyl-terminal hydrolase n=1 Tax=Frankliniella occidentalis TaxID=133901 RepID=A0A9C6X692_FRAOC|nr:ubiquitin carboxyl-terminal hydrolase 15 [Frankliniella occidentalis]
MVKMESSDMDTESLLIQKKKIEEYVSRKLVEGEKWFLVARSWYERLIEYLTDTNDTRDSYHPGPIDNSSIIQMSNGKQKLKDHLIDEMDYKLLPEDIWDYIVTNYGISEGQEPISRAVVDVGQFAGHLKVEVYLMEIELCKDFNLNKTISHRFSRKEKTSTLHSVARTVFEIPSNVTSQLWTCISETSYNLIKDSDSTLQDEMIFPSCVVILDTQQPDGNFASKEHMKKLDIREPMGRSPILKETNKNTAIPLPAPDTPSTSPPMTTRYSIQHSVSVTTGLCGLSNLGNTCFMNSVLQCMSNTPPITDYFLNDHHHQDLNVDNPLGMRGEIAKSFGELIKVMWSGTSSTVPHHFKLQVSKFAPQFSGYQQHDAQELLTFLLDGLHEDLNRIHDKPYIKQRDSDGRPDEVVAAEAWSNYKKRNDSIIVELFHGLLKSTVWCPRCKITSVTFDPSCYLSLPLPTKLERHVEVLFFPYTGEQKPTLYKVQVPQRARMEDVFIGLHKLTNYPVDQMIATEVFKHHFQRIFDSTDTVDTFADDRERLHVYLIPVSIHDKKYVSLPVCQWELDARKEFANNQLFGLPVFVVVPRNGCTYTQLFNAILKRMAPFLNITVTSNPTYKSFDDDAVHHNGSMKDSEDEDEDSDGKPPNNDGLEPMDVHVEYSGSSGFEFDHAEEDWDRDDDEQKYTNGDSSNQSSSFRVFIVNNHRIQSVASPDMDTKVIHFPDSLGRQFLVVQWTSASRQTYFKESAARDFDKHESLHSTMRPNGVDLKDCLTLYTNTEKLDASEAWYCPKCKDHIEATKKFDLWNLPRILVIHLKRFHYNRYRRDKIDTTVNFPLRGLQLRDYISDPHYDKNTTYDLIGVCNHYGNLAGGHYTAYGLNKVENAWYLFDDNHVRKASESSVVSNSAYVLFYMRRDAEEMQQ